MSALVERCKSSLIGTRLGELAQTRSHARYEAKLSVDPKLKKVAREVYDIDACIRRLVDRADMNCVDCGAHLGSVTAEFLKLAPQGSHTAFEPTPRKAGWLAKKFPQVKVHQKAVSDTPGKATFFDNTGDSGFSGLRAPGGFSNGLQEFEVEIVRLDDVLAGVDVGFMKVDVEGAELGAFRGCRETFARCRPPMLFECTKTGLDNFGVDPDDVYDELTETSGYDLYIPRDFLDAGNVLTRRQFASSMQYPFDAFNYIAIPR